MLRGFAQIGIDQYDRLAATGDGDSEVGSDRVDSEVVGVETTVSAYSIVNCGDTLIVNASETLNAGSCDASSVAVTMIVAFVRS